MAAEEIIIEEEAPRYLLDTNIVSELIKPDASFSVVQKISEHNSDCAICAPAWQELQFGVELLQDGAQKAFLKKFVEELCGDFKILNYSKKAAEAHAKLRQPHDFGHRKRQAFYRHPKSQRPASGKLVGVKKTAITVFCIKRNNNLKLFH